MESCMSDKIKLHGLAKAPDSEFHIIGSGYITYRGEIITVRNDSGAGEKVTIKHQTGVEITVPDGVALRFYRPEISGV